MITEEHFEVLRQMSEESAKLRLACIAAGAGSLLHIVHDRNISPRMSPNEKALFGKLRVIQ